MRYHLLSRDESTTELSIAVKGFPELAEYGANELLAKEYGEWIQATPKSSFDLTLVLSSATLTDEAIRRVSLLKRNCFAAPFNVAFDAQEKGTTTTLMIIPYRDEEAIFVQGHSDRVTVHFSVLFKDASDVVYSKVFLQEFVDARKHPALQNAPQVLFSKEPPAEIASVAAAKPNLSFVTFVLFDRHFAKSRREETISLIQTFRDYLHYHIKCSKAHLHTRMRAKVQQFLKVLNRAKPDVVVKPSARAK